MSGTKRKIRDTDIVYSAISDTRSLIRFALHPVLHGEPSPYEREQQRERRLSVRATWCSFLPSVGPGSIMLTSCLSVQARPGEMYMSRRTWDDSRDDRFLDWLAEGEPGR